MQPSTSYDNHQRAKMEGSRTNFPPEILALAERLRGFIRETVPDAEERVYKGGCAAGYHDKRSGCFCAFWIEEKGVFLTFPKGEFLPDPEGLLKSSGKQMSYLILQPGAAFPEDALFHLIVAALLYGAK